MTNLLAHKDAAFMGESELTGRKFMLAVAKDVGKAFGLILSSRARGVVVTAYAKYVRQIACLMAQQHIEGMIVAHFGWFASDWWGESEEHSCTLEQMKSATNLFIQGASPAWNSLDKAVPCGSSHTYTFIFYLNRSMLIVLLTALSDPARPHPIRPTPTTPLGIRPWRFGLVIFMS